MLGIKKFHMVAVLVTGLILCVFCVSNKLHLRIPNASRNAAPAGLVLSRGPVLADRIIGAGGGTVDVPGQVSVQFPAGALVRNERVVIRAVTPSPAGAQFYSIDRDGGHNALAHPSVVRFPMPKGIDGNRVTGLQELSGGFWAQIPGSYDSNSHTLTVGTQHFSNLGWVETAGTNDNDAPRLRYMDDVLELSTQVTSLRGRWSRLGLLMPRHIDLDHAIQTSDGFSIYWTESPDSSDAIHAPADQKLYVECDADNHPVMKKRKDGRFYGWHSQEANGVDKDPDQEAVPMGVLVLAAELSQVKKYYKLANYNVPDTMTITVSSDISSSAGGKNAGEWDSSGRYMVINNEFVSDFRDKDLKVKRQATLAHEYFHALFEASSYSEGPFRGLEDGLTTTMEAEVFPGNEDTYRNYAYDYPAVFASGLRVMDGSAAEDKNIQTRGYRLWPWGRYILHTEGHEALRKLASGEIKDRLALAQNLFRGFVDTLMMNGNDLKDSLPQVPPVAVPTKDPLSVVTGWSKTDLTTFLPMARGLPAYNTNVFFSPGRYDLPGVLRSPRPLAFFELGVKFEGIPKLSPDEYSLSDAPIGIVRRLRPDTTERFILAIPPSAHFNGLARSQTTAITRREGGAVIAREWMEQSPGKDLLFAIGVAGMATDEQVGESNPLLIYYLPRFKGLKLETDASNAETFLKWDELTNVGLPPSLVFSGYRIFGRDSKGKQEVLTDLIISGSLTDTAGSHDGKTIAIGENDRSVSLPKAMLEIYDAVGLACVDAAMKDKEGKPIVGEITWLNLGGTVDGTVDRGGDNPLPAVDVPVSLTYTLGPTNPVKKPIVKTDPQGRFAFHHIPGGAEFTVSAENGDEKNTMPVPPKLMTVHLTAASEVDLAAYLLPQNALPMGLKETARGHDELATQKIVTQDLVSPKPADVGGDSQPVDYNTNPLFPSMNEGAQKDWEFQEKAKALIKSAAQESKKPPKRQIIARVSVQRPTSAPVREALLKGIVETGHLIKQPDSSYRSSEAAGKLAIFWERGDLLVGVGCSSGDGDMHVLENLRAAADQHIIGVNAGKNKQ